MQIPPELAIPYLYDFPPIFYLQCKVAMKHYIESVNFEQRQLPKATIDKLGQVYARVADACPHCEYLYKQQLQSEADNMIAKFESQKTAKSNVTISSPGDSHQYQANLQVSDLGAQGGNYNSGIQAMVDNFMKLYNVFQNEPSDAAFKQFQTACEGLNQALKDGSGISTHYFRLEAQNDAIISRIRSDIAIKDQLLNEKFSGCSGFYAAYEELPVGEVEDTENLKKLLQSKEVYLQQLRNELRLVKKQQLFKTLFTETASFAYNTDRYDEQQSLEEKRLADENQKLYIRIEQIYAALRDTNAGSQALPEYLRKQSIELEARNAKLEKQLKAETLEKERYMRLSAELQEYFRTLSEYL